ncbi:MAG: hypothetical protein ACD_83C00034G0002 [uncultured bacterium]|uniref:methionyl-tRNA formyltransferase n=1 Tax=Berkelbacteria bacterium GW2011_GWA2_38_9 TaxID=1618334 RepID=A0A0G0LHV1_9BACT|nr:MAG: hypothetical protein ACD_83C00034G0002 [uncultured bacterium]KKQ90607.1 MAG: Methionyl-tRNA formyltransferase [Berkelbacteria bacterium GW2011_GWA2_38_9]
MSKVKNKSQNLKVLFLGSGLFAAQVIEELAKQKFPLDEVLGLLDKKAGRGQKNIELPVKLAVQKTDYNLTEFISKEEFSNILESSKSDVVVVADFGWIIFDNDLKKAKKAFLNIHPSLLPKYRGPSPIQSAILAGDQSTGVTLMEMDQQMDHGPIIAQEFVEISAVETTGSLILKTALTGAQLLIDNLPKYLDGSLSPTDQDHQQATFCQMIKKIDGQIDWTKPAIEIDRQVRALNIWPKASTTFCGKHLIIHSGHISGNQYIPDLVQLEGRKIIRWQDFLNGQRISESQALLELTAKM